MVGKPTGKGVRAGELVVAADGSFEGAESVVGAAIGDAVVSAGAIVGDRFTLGLDLSGEGTRGVGVL